MTEAHTDGGAQQLKLPWHTLAAPEVLARLETTAQGLSGAEAAARLAIYGPNALQAAQRLSPWTILLEQFKNILIIILLIATLLSAFLGHGVEAIAITVIVLFAVALGFVQEYRAERAIVAGTGAATEFGRIAQMLQTVETTRTPLQRNLDRVGRALAYAALVLVVIIIGLGLLRGQPFFEMLIFGIALAVAVVPEALPAVVTISLAIGVQRMVKRHALVRRLPAVETLGSTSVICSDKTGTLTKDEMTVQQLVVAGHRWEVTGAGYAPEGEFRTGGRAAPPSTQVLELLTGATLASDAGLVRDAEGRWHVQGDPTEGALVTAAGKAGLHKSDLEARHPRVDEIPFTSESKRMTTLHRFPDGVVAFAKGAAEVILAACSRQV
jgi:Ca2+-transporting ATPase